MPHHKILFKAISSNVPSIFKVNFYFWTVLTIDEFYRSLKSFNKTCPDISDQKVWNNDLVEERNIWYFELILIFHNGSFFVWNRHWSSDLWVAFLRLRFRTQTWKDKAAGVLISFSFELSSVNGPKTGRTTFLLSLTLTNLFSDGDNYFGIRHHRQLWQLPEVRKNYHQVYGKGVEGFQT